MRFVLAMGLMPHQIPTVVYIASLFKPPPPLGRLDQLPAEIICLIAEIVTDEWVKEREEQEGDAACHCACDCPTGASHIRGVADDVKALAGTCRGLRGVLVNGGFFSKISLSSKVNDLYRRMSVATGGFMENVTGAALRFDYEGGRNEALDPSLRYAFGILENVRDLWMEWSSSNAKSVTASKKKPPKTLPIIDRPEPLSNLEVLNLNMSDRKGGITAVSRNGKIESQPTITYHLSQLLSILRSSSLEALQLRLHLVNSKVPIRYALKTILANLKDLQFPKLQRLGITAFFAVESKKEVVGNWMPTLSRLLKRVGAVSDKFTDLDIVIHVDIMELSVFTKEGEHIDLPDLIPTRQSVFEAIRKVLHAGYKVPPFTLQIIGNSQIMPDMAISLMLCEYMPAEEESDKDETDPVEVLRASILSQIKQLPRSAISPSGPIVGGDEFRYNLNQAALVELYMDVGSMSRVRGLQEGMFDEDLMGDPANDFGGGNGNPNLALEAMLFEQFFASGMI